MSSDGDGYICIGCFYRDSHQIDFDDSNQIGYGIELFFVKHKKEIQQEQAFQAGSLGTYEGVLGVNGCVSFFGFDGAYLKTESPHFTFKFLQTDMN